jgi:uncharacterized protein (TIGR03437 family)
VSGVPPPPRSVWTAALNEDGSYNVRSNPAAPGSILVFWANGAGVFTSALSDGEVVPSVLPLPAPVLPVSVLFDNQPVELVYEGAAPAVVAGLMQVNARLPPTIGFGSYHTLQLKIGNSTSALVQVAAYP